MSIPANTNLHKRKPPTSPQNYTKYHKENVCNKYHKDSVCNNSGEIIQNAKSKIRKFVQNLETREQCLSLVERFRDPFANAINNGEVIQIHREM